MGLQETSFGAQAQRHQPPELWFHVDCDVGVHSGTITATVRLGERTERHAKGYVVGECVVLRCMVDRTHECVRRWAIVECVFVTTLRQLRSEDLTGCPPSERNPFPPAEYLAANYGRPIESDEPITVIRFVPLPIGYAPARAV